MRRLLARGAEIGREVQRRRISAIAGELRQVGLAAVENATTVTVTGSDLLRRWIAEPALRFVGRIPR